MSRPPHPLWHHLARILLRELERQLVGLSQDLKRHDAVPWAQRITAPAPAALPDGTRARRPTSTWWRDPRGRQNRPFLSGSDRRP